MPKGRPKPCLHRAGEKGLYRMHWATCQARSIINIYDENRMQSIMAESGLGATCVFGLNDTRLAVAEGIFTDKS